LPRGQSAFCLRESLEDNDDVNQYSNIYLLRSHQRCATSSFVAYPSLIIATKIAVRYAGFHSMLNGAKVAIVIVGFRNPQDVEECLAALARAEREPTFAILICENGGRVAFDGLVSTLSANNAPCEGQTELISPTFGGFVRVCRLRLRADGPLVFVGEARENLGYAGAINAWLRVLQDLPGWEGVWVINPDTQPESDALAELVAYSYKSGKGMLGGRIIRLDQPDVEHSRGLHWRPWHASLKAVDFQASAYIEPDIAAVEAGIDAPSGACVYVTRSCLGRIGLMDERYFLYFEDIEWGIRAKRTCGVGYAWKAVVYHRGGTTIGTASTRSARSPLSVYLEFRNRLLFVRQHHKRWYAWTIFVLTVRALEYGAVWHFANLKAAYQGLAAGLAGETGRPDHFMSAASLVSGRRSSPN
jgi:N-acetylglucosaminyl-diphospho-decaprenol L-rhamnosyltransferase